MKNVLLIALLAIISISSTAQVYAFGESTYPSTDSLYYTTHNTDLYPDTFQILHLDEHWYMRLDTLQITGLADAKVVSTSPNYFLYADSQGQIFKARTDSIYVDWARIQGEPTFLTEEVTLTEGFGINITGTYPDFTISLLLEEAPEAPQQFNTQVAADYVIQKVEYYDMDGNLIEPAIATDYIVKTTFLNGQTVTQHYSRK